jgi:MazG family protein
MAQADDSRSIDGPFARLVDLVRTLRSPNGCPWDRAQTLESLRPFVIEEAYEVLEAIDDRDMAALRVEIGDLVFEAVLLAQLCEETGAFSIAESLDAISDKLVRRHPHVFGPTPRDGAPDADGVSPRSPDEVVERWEELKARERGEAGSRVGTLRGIPKTLPGLLRAYEIGTRVAAVGFDWDTARDVLTKIDEEVAELRESIERTPPGADRSAAEEEMGDLLFALANLSRKLGLEPEAALRRANDKFVRRFTQLEQRFESQGRVLHGAPLEEMEREWQEIKRTEKP